MKKNITRYPLILIFAFFIFSVSLADGLEPDHGYSDLENRSLMQRPKLTTEHLISNEFSKKYEEYIDDQFLGRNLWIDLKSRAEFCLGKVENNGIIYGRDHHMFEKYKTTNELRLKKNTAFVKQFIESCDYPVTFGIIPSSYMKNQDKLPYGLGNLDQYQRIEEIDGQMADTKNAQEEGTKILDLNKMPLEYYKTDHHWQTDGAYAAYGSLMEQMGLPQISEERLQKLKKTEPGFLGTYFNKTKAFNAVPDDIVYYDIPVKSITINGKPTQGLYDFSKFKTRDKYGMFLHGNNGITEIKSAELLAEVKKDSRILLIKDSFGNSFAPFLTYDFQQVSVVDLRSIGGKLSQYMKENHFDQVVILYNFMNFAQDANIAKITY